MSDFETRIDTTIARFDGVNSSAVYLGGAIGVGRITQDELFRYRADNADRNV